ncbi:hypothetical protein LMG27952_06915 [Paraburkholderia hiiakae]|uniref:Uncharacterized protein n=1 Tax=Paraburkholderia hiiakae TaxID=1081782 RepID=A0ABN7IH81_9BURK|nr:hypothetical protein [Paraburkholderia hiiakae]CAD6559608.1 hypothetical protein LMG27952_06915 [Paraburkholderia hiiakae]
MAAWDMAKSALKYANPTAWLVVEGVELAANAVAKASAQGVDELRAEVAKQDLQMKFAQHQARVAQELAIARRIDNAEEVEIEEFYNVSGKGNVGLTVDAEGGTGTLGLGGEGSKVTKRIYRFKGLNKEMQQVFVQNQSDDTSTP